MGKWARFRKTSRERYVRPLPPSLPPSLYLMHLPSLPSSLPPSFPRLLRGFSPLRRSISTTTHHPSAPRVYQFFFFYSLWAVCFLSPVAHMLLNETPYLHVKKGELDKRAMGWVVVEVGREGWKEGARKIGAQARLLFLPPYFFPFRPFFYCLSFPFSFPSFLGCHPVRMLAPSLGLPLVQTRP